MIARLRRGLDRIRPAFEEGGRLAPLHPLFEMVDTILFTPATVTRTASHVRDAIDLKRMMTVVVAALAPCLAMAAYNTGYQALRVVAAGGAPLDDWRAALYALSGLGHDPSNVLFCVAYGALYLVPVLAVCFAAGGAVEIAFAAVRKHEVYEGFFVTGFLIPLILPPTIPLWQVALGTAFGVIFGKEIFGGTGMNFLNPALVARAFLFFAYPADISGDGPWIAAGTAGVDQLSGATLLAGAAAEAGFLDRASWTAAFLGRIPGSMGETSALACLLGAVLLVGTRVASWRTMAGVTLGTFATASLLNAVGSDANPMFGVPFHWHVVLGGWALGTVFMATDPVSSAFTDTGKWWYGIGIGVLAILIRAVNPAYPEGMMLAILFMNMFAPVIDHLVVRGNVKRRTARSAL